MKLPLTLAVLINILGLVNASLRPWSTSNTITYGRSISSNRAFVLDRQQRLAAAVTNQDECSNQYKTMAWIHSLRGGSSATTKDEVENDSEYEDEYDSDEEEEYDEETDEETDEEVEESSSNESSLASSLQSKSTNQSYDTLLTPPPMQQMLISLSIMFLSQRIDIFSPKVVTVARAAFVGYLIAVQLFLLYVRTRVKHRNDRTVITISNPLASLVEGIQQSGAAGPSKNPMVKSLASQILTQQTTVYDYDMQQIKSMQSALLMPMVFIYFLHFRMKQMQPLLMQTATGVMNLVYSPLWQVYVLGRNLERPFGRGGAANVEDVTSGAGESGESDVTGTEEATVEEESEKDLDSEVEDSEEEGSYDGESEESDDE